MRLHSFYDISYPSRGGLHYPRNNTSRIWILGNEKQNGNHIILGDCSAATIGIPFFRSLLV